ncbi:hypothetical protein B484DRAFT_439810 [Ochromonadaceae sp. CCMP2298]|nr:hypothetical protein B484DRAFT_439810 [Ochromonadaceae sp. CCMP2298]
MSAEEEIDLGLNPLMGDEGGDQTMHEINHILGTPARQYLMWMARNVPPLAPYTLDSALNQYTFECITYLLSDDERLGLYDGVHMRHALGEAESSNSDTADLILSAEEEAEDMEALQTSDESPVESPVYSSLSVSPGAVPEEAPALAPAQPRRRRVRVYASKTCNPPLSDEDRNILEDEEDEDYAL